MTTEIATNRISQFEQHAVDLYKTVSQAVIYFGHVVYAICVRYMAAFEGTNKINEVFIRYFWEGKFNSGLELSCLTKKEICALSVDEFDLPFLSKWYHIFNEAMAHVLIDHKRVVLQQKRDHVIDRFIEKTNGEIDKLKARLDTNFHQLPQTQDFLTALRESRRRVENLLMATQEPITAPSTANIVLHSCDETLPAITHSDKLFASLAAHYEACLKNINHLEEQFVQGREKLNIDQANPAVWLVLNACGLRLQGLRGRFEKSYEDGKIELKRQQEALSKTRQATEQKKEELTHSLELSSQNLSQNISQLKTELANVRDTIATLESENEALRHQRTPSPVNPHPDPTQIEIDRLRQELASVRQQQESQTISSAELLQLLRREVRTLTQLNQALERRLSLRHPRPLVL